MLMGGLCLFTACEDDRDSNPTIQQPESFVLNEPAYAGNLIDLQTSSTLNLSCAEQPDYGYTAVVTYQPQVSLTGEFTVSTDEAEAAEEAGDASLTADYSIVPETSTNVTMSMTAEALARQLVRLAKWTTETVPATQTIYLRTFYDDMNARYHAAGHADSDIYMVGEVLSEHNEVTPYYAGLPALFEFSFWYRLKDAINEGTGRYFAKNIMGYRDEYQAVRPDYIAATKLTNHDEDRAASLLGSSADKCRLAAAVLLTASGTPYIYYGEELGVTGTKQQGDENVRQPMPWTDVDAQEADPGSLLSAYRTLTALRNTYPALATGRMEKHPVYNDTNAAYNQLAAWYMVDDASGQRLLVLHNFDPAATELSLTDKVQRPLAALGTVQQSTAADGTTQLRLGGYSSAVYLLE